MKKINLKYVLLPFLLPLGLVGCSTQPSKVETVEVAKPRIVYRTCGLDFIKPVQYPIIKGDRNKDLLILIMDYEKELRRVDFDIYSLNEKLKECKKK